MRIGIALDHGGFELKKPILDTLHTLAHEVVDFGAYSLVPEDDYPDFVVPWPKRLGMVKWNAALRCAAAEWGPVSRPIKFRGYAQP
jgi:hypothetical protein